MTQNDIRQAVLGKEPSEAFEIIAGHRTPDEPWTFRVSGYDGHYLGPTGRFSQWRASLDVRDGKVDGVSFG